MTTDPMSEYTKMMERAQAHRPGPGRTAGVAIFLASPFAPRARILRMGEDAAENPSSNEAEWFAQEHDYRFRGAMGHAGAQYLAKRVLPEETAFYYTKDDQGYRDGVLFVPYHAGALARLLLLMGDTFLHVKLPAFLVETPGFDEGDLTDTLKALFDGTPDPAEGDCAEMEVALLGGDDAPLDFPESALDPFVEAVSRLFKGRMRTMTETQQNRAFGKLVTLANCLERIENACAMY